MDNCFAPVRKRTESIGIVTTLSKTLVQTEAYSRKDTPIPMQNYDDVAEVIEVSVNQRQTFNGLQIKGDLYVPFKFLESYYEIYGYMSQNENSKKYIWQHSNAVLSTGYKSGRKYSTTGVYLSMEESNVSNRARVKCIHGLHQIPVSTQWDVKGYFYPTQVAQYGLSHLSKYFMEDLHTMKMKVYDVDSLSENVWKSNGYLRNVYDSSKKSHVISYKAEEEAPTLLLDSDLTILSSYIKFEKQTSWFIVRVEASDNKVYNLKYITDDTLIDVVDGLIVHGIGSRSQWSMMMRDLNVDLVKGLGFQKMKKQTLKIEVFVKKVLDITFFGSGYIRNITLAVSNNIDRVMAAADWFVANQDNVGGWKNNVPRHVFKGMYRAPGWYSAMAQGQAISLLCRVYHLTKKSKYLRTALRATQVFEVSSYGDGVLADLFGQPWYEEYPTNPSLFVLNGFMFSLFGLYDLSKTAVGNESLKAEQLFKEGLRTLISKISLFDNGQGTFYDLRHLTVPGTPPNRARWDYHVVHLEQLQALVGITGNPVLNRILQRWKGYLVGERANHN